VIQVTVSELIKRLQELPGDVTVVIRYPAICPDCARAPLGADRSGKVRDPIFAVYGHELDDPTHQRVIISV
jgi:hypothetical protein